MNVSTNAVLRGATLERHGKRWVCEGQGHIVWVSVERYGESAPEEAARIWLKMVETDDLFD